MVKVLHVIPSLGSGGAERQIVDLVKNTDPTKFSHTVCYFKPPCLFEEDIRKAGGKVICLNETGKRPWITAACALTRLIEKEKPTLIHSWLLDATMAVRLACLSNRQLPRVVSLCGPDYEPETIRFAGWPRWKVEILRAIDSFSGRFFQETFVACSNFIRESGKRRLGIQTAQIQTIYNSVDPETVDVSIPKGFRESIGVPKSAVLFANVARLDPQKGQTYLLQALKQIESVAPDAHLLLIGEGGMERELKQLTETLGLTKRVHFLGVRNDVGACLKASDIFVFPSVFEGFGMALIEAMFVGLPVIAFDVGPIPEILTNEKLGRLVPVGDVPRLAEAMLHFYQEKEEREEIGKRGRENSLGRFSSQRAIVPAWQKVYSQMANEVRA